ncbi:MAG: RNA polymerase sigma factor [Marinilabilia sp.]
MQSSFTDNELAEQAMQGRTEAFSILVERYRQKVFRTAMGFLHNADDAEDLTQEIFIKAWHALRSFNRKSAFSTWLYRISVNKAINQTRKNKLKALAGINDEVNNTRDNESADDTITRKEQKEEIKNAINKLNNKQKKAFVLFYYQELSMKEVADVLKMSKKAAESLVFRARQNLQKELSGKNNR